MLDLLFHSLSCIMSKLTNLQNRDWSTSKISAEPWDHFPQKVHSTSLSRVCSSSFATSWFIKLWPILLLLDLQLWRQVSLHLKKQALMWAKALLVILMSIHISFMKWIVEKPCINSPQEQTVLLCLQDPDKHSTSVFILIKFFRIGIIV